MVFTSFYLFMSETWEFSLMLVLLNILIYTPKTSLSFPFPYHVWYHHLCSSHNHLLWVITAVFLTHGVFQPNFSLVLRFIFLKCKSDHVTILLKILRWMEFVIFNMVWKASLSGLVLPLQSQVVPHSPSFPLVQARWFHQGFVQNHPVLPGMLSFVFHLPVSLSVLYRSHISVLKCHFFRGFCWPQNLN